MAPQPGYFGGDDPRVLRRAGHIDSVREASLTSGTGLITVGSELLARVVLKGPAKTGSCAI